MIPTTIVVKHNEVDVSGSNNKFSKLINKNPCTTSIGGMKIKFLELQDDDKESKKVRFEELPEGSFRDLSISSLESNTLPCYTKCLFPSSIILVLEQAPRRAGQQKSLTSW